jgi:ketosteroid isomerase-like protein
MSEQQNVQTVQAAYAAFKRGDIQGVINTLADEIEWHTPGEGLIPQGGVHRGKDAVSRFFQTIDQTMEFASFDPQTFVAQGDNVVATGSYDGTVKTTNRHFGAEWAMVFTFKGSKVVRFQEYTDTAAIASAYAGAKAA